MDDATMEKYGALGALWFVAFVVVGSLLPGPPPDRTDTAAEIRDYLVDNDTAIQVGGLLMAIGIIGLVWFIGSLWRAIAQAEQGRNRVSVIVLAGFVFGGAMATGAFATQIGAASMGTALTEETAQLSFSVMSVMLGFSTMSDVIVALALAGLLWRTAFLPRWLVYPSLAVAIASGIAAVGIASDAAFFGLMGFVAFLIWAAWLVALGVTLFRRNADLDGSQTLDLRQTADEPSAVSA